MKLLSKLRSYSKIVGGLTALIGAVVLLGWLLKWEIVKSILPGWATMKANTALGLIFGGLGLWLWHEGQKYRSKRGCDSSDKRYKWLLNSSRIAAIAIILIGLLTLIQYSWNINLGIDELLFEDESTNRFTSHPGRMAPTIALIFCFIGIALLLLHLKRYNTMQLFTMMSTITAALGLLGYLYQMPGLYAIGSYTAMAVHTSLSLILLSSGILFSCPGRGWLNVITSPYAGGLVSRRLLPGIIGVPLMLGGIYVISYHLAPGLIEISFAIISLSNIIILAAVMWWTARYLNALDLKNQHAQFALRQSYENLEQKVQERTVQLAESRKQLANLINTLPGIVFCREPHEAWSMNYLSAGCFPLTGYRFEDLTSRTDQTYNDLILEQDRLRVFDAIQRAIAHQQPYEIEYRICPKFGKEQWVWEKGCGIFNEAGTLLSIEGFISNITTLKQTEAALQESRNRLRAIIDAEPECVKLVAADGRLLEINTIGLEILEVERADTILGSSIYSFIAPEYQDAYRRLNQRVCAGHSEILEFQIISAKGKRRWMETHAVPLQIDTNELTCQLAITRDISDRKLVEVQRQSYLTELDQWRHRYEIAAQISGQILYEWDSRTSQRTWGPNTEQILGYSSSEMPKTVDEYLLLIHPSYRFKIHNKIQKFLEEKNFLRLEYLLQCRDQSYIWVEDRCQFFKNQIEENIKVVGFIENISDRKRSEEALRSEQEKFQQIAENIQEVFFINVADLSQILYVSPAYEMIWGRSCESLYQNSQTWYEAIHPQDLEQVRNALEGMRQGQPFQQDYRIIRPDGSIRWIRSRTFAAYDDNGQIISYPGIAEDITERKQAEIALRHSEERYRSLVQATSQVIWTTDATGQMVTPQASWSAYTGQSFEEYRGWGWKAALHPDDQEQTARIWSQAVQGSYLYQTECRIQAIDGTYRYFWVRGVPVLEADGHIREWVGACTDITERKEAEFAIFQLNQDLEERVKERTAALQATNQELEAFCYSVSHDLRAPLRHISGFTRILQQKYTEHLDEKGQHYVQRINVGAQRMEELINDLLALSRINRSEIKRTEVNLSAIAQEIADTLNESQPERQVEWAIAPSIMTRGDERLLRVVLENLLNNAWKFTANQTLARIEFNANSADLGEEVIYSIRDNGAGFNMAYSDKLFKVFQRLHTEQEFSGTGIGLATVQRIIHRHGGRVWATGQPDQGATFYFTVNS